MTPSECLRALQGAVKKHEEAYKAWVDAGSIVGTELYAKFRQARGYRRELQTAFHTICGLTVDEVREAAKLGCADESEMAHMVEAVLRNKIKFPLAPNVGFYVDNLGNVRGVKNGAAIAVIETWSEFDYD